MGYYEFPNTRNYDSDLGFLIKKYKELGNDYDTLVQIYEELKKIYEMVQADIKDITMEQLQKWLDDGTLENLISALGGIIRVFDTTEDMIASPILVNGLVVKTLGYSKINDGGGATFKITNVMSSTEFQFSCDRGLFATLIYQEYTNVLCFGVVPNNNNEINMNLLSTVFNLKIPLYFSNGIYYSNNTINVYNNVFMEENAIIQNTAPLEYGLIICPSGSAIQSQIGLDIQINYDGNNQVTYGIGQGYIRQSKLVINVKNCIDVAYHYGYVTHGNNENRITLYIKNSNIGLLCDGNDSIFDLIVVIDCIIACQLETLLNCLEFHPWLQDRESTIFNQSIGILVNSNLVVGSIKDFRIDGIKTGISANQNYSFCFNINTVRHLYNNADGSTNNGSSLYEMPENYNANSIIKIGAYSGTRNLFFTPFIYNNNVFLEVTNYDFNNAQGTKYTNVNELPSQGTFICNDTTNFPSGVSGNVNVHCWGNTNRLYQQFTTGNGVNIYQREKTVFTGLWQPWYKYTITVVE